MYQRLLYSVAQLQDCNQKLNEQGMIIILRSTRDEEDAVACNLRLQDCIYEFLGSSPDADKELISAVRTGSADGERCASFMEFVGLLEGVEPGSERLRQISAVFKAKCSEKGKLDDLVQCAQQARDSLATGLSKVYVEWYRDSLDPAEHPMKKLAPGTAFEIQAGGKRPIRVIGALMALADNALKTPRSYWHVVTNVISGLIEWIKSVRCKTRDKIDRSGCPERVFSGERHPCSIGQRRARRHNFVVGGAIAS
jgi:hypothetical protein